MKRRQSILLLELLISLLIMGIVLEMLFLGYRQAVFTQQKFCKEQEIVLRRQRLLSRLGTVFQTLQSCQKVTEGWFLRYDGGMDPEIHFRGPLEALLSVKGGQLLLISWPQAGPPRVETLYEDKDMKTLSFQFFDSKRGEFRPLFPETPPIMMKLIIDSTLVLPFFL